MRRLLHQRGQATVEYAGLVLLVLAVLLAAGVLFPGLRAAASSLAQTIACRLLGGACPASVARLPSCETSSVVRGQRASVAVSFVRIGQRSVLEVRHFSDRSVTVTLLDAASAGAVAGVGARVRAGRLAIGLQTEVGADLGFSAGRTWTFHDERRATAFVRDYARGQSLLDRAKRAVTSSLCPVCAARRARVRRPPPPDRVSKELDGDATGRVTVGAGPVRLGGAEALRGAVGVTDDRRTGARTLFYRVDHERSSELDGILGATWQSGSQGTLLALTLDHRGQPTRLAVGGRMATSGGSLSRAQGAPDLQTLLRVAGVGSSRAETGRALDFSARLDLTEPSDREAALALVGALRPRVAALRRLPGAAEELVRRLVRDGVLQVTERRTSSSDSAVGGTVAAGEEVGAEVGQSSMSSQLLDAYVRLPGRGFVQRRDCLPRRA